MTDALKIITENVAVPAASLSNGEAGKSLSVRWSELGKQSLQKESRTSEEIIDSIRQKLESGGEAG